MNKITELEIIRAPGGVVRSLYDIAQNVTYFGIVALLKREKDESAEQLGKEIDIRRGENPLLQRILEGETTLKQAYRKVRKDFRQEFFREQEQLEDLIGMEVTEHTNYIRTNSAGIIGTIAGIISGYEVFYATQNAVEKGLLLRDAPEYAIQAFTYGPAALCILVGLMAGTIIDSYKNKTRSEEEMEIMRRIEILNGIIRNYRKIDK